MKSTDRSGSTHPHDRRIADRAQDDAVDDHHGRRMKPPGPTVCPHCGAVFHEGRWQWMRLPMEANRASCPACQRVHDDYPAGIVSLTGSFVLGHRDELRALARHQDEIEKAKHALTMPQDGCPPADCATMQIGCANAACSRPIPRSKPGTTGSAGTRPPAFSRTSFRSTS